LFGERLPSAERYAGLLASAGVERGLIGPREVPRLWDRHLLNCGVITGLIGASVDVCDVGSGAGLPGIVVALVRPDLSVTLVEPLLRRSTFLEQTVDELELENVTVLRARAEELAGTLRVDVVTARAVAPLERLAGWTLPLLRAGGEVLALKGRTAWEEAQSSAAALEAMGVRSVLIQRVGESYVEPPATVVRLRRSAPSSSVTDRTAADRGRDG
jgi:16S rRNA (guanine527-N7)-methyltransferase